MKTHTNLLNHELLDLKYYSQKAFVARTRWSVNRNIGRRNEDSVHEPGGTKRPRHQHPEFRSRRITTMRRGWTVPSVSIFTATVGCFAGGALVGLAECCRRQVLA